MTYKELETHLLAVMDYADDTKKSVVNKAMTKGYTWNLFMDMVIAAEDKDKQINEMAEKNILREFPRHLVDPFDGL